MGGAAAVPQGCSPIRLMTTPTAQSAMAAVTCTACCAQGRRRRRLRVCYMRIQLRAVKCSNAALYIPKGRSRCRERCYPSFVVVSQRVIVSMRIRWRLSLQRTVRLRTASTLYFFSDLTAAHRLHRGPNPDPVIGAGTLFAVKTGTFKSDRQPAPAAALLFPALGRHGSRQGSWKGTA